MQKKSRVKLISTNPDFSWHFIPRQETNSDVKQFHHLTYLVPYQQTCWGHYTIALDVAVVGQTYQISRPATMGVTSLISRQKTITICFMHKLI
jgi:hypothetical protein